MKRFCQSLSKRNKNSIRHDWSSGTRFLKYCVKFLVRLKCLPVLPTPIIKVTPSCVLSDLMDFVRVPVHPDPDLPSSYPRLRILLSVSSRVSGVPPDTERKVLSTCTKKLSTCVSQPVLTNLWKSEPNTNGVFDCSLSIHFTLVTPSYLSLYTCE